jgi:hypothetical protein
VIDPDLRKTKRFFTERYLSPQAELARRWGGRSGPLPDALLARANVHQVCIARKVINRQSTPLPCVQIGVFRKLSLGELRRAGVKPIERNLRGIPTDIVERPPLDVSFQVNHTTSPDAAELPLRPGSQISHGNMAYGTLGAFCTSTLPEERESIYLLSCRHVIAGFDVQPLLKPIFRSWRPPSEGFASAVAAHASRFVDARGVKGSALKYSADAAIACLESDVEFQPDYIDSAHRGDRRDPLEVTERDLLTRDVFSKSGAATGLTLGVLTGLLCDVTATYGGRERIFEDQILIKPIGRETFSEKGDSGAMVVHRASGRCVGLLMGSRCGPDGNEAVVSPLAPILTELQIELL